MEGGDEGEDDERSHGGTGNDGNWRRVDQKPASLASESSLRAYAEPKQMAD